MPKIRTELAEGKEPVEGKNYIVTDVEETTSPVQKFPAYRVCMKSENPEDTDEYASMCWKRDVVGENSKLGSFLKAFIDFFEDEIKALDTDNWLGHEIRVISWSDKNREIRVIE